MPKVLKTSATPNPLALKFHTDCQVLVSGSRSFPSAVAAKGEPVAEAIFGLPEVTSVFYVGNVITVNQSGMTPWDGLVPQIADIIEERLVPAESAPAVSTWDPFASGADIEAPVDFMALDKEAQLKHLNQVLDEMVRPGLAGDGGGLALMDIVEREVLIHYEGACGSCPSATQGTMDYIERVLRDKADPDLMVISM